MKKPHPLRLVAQNSQVNNAREKGSLTNISWHKAKRSRVLSSFAQSIWML